MGKSLLNKNRNVAVTNSKSIVVVKCSCFLSLILRYVRTVLKHQSNGTKCGAKIKIRMCWIIYQHWFENSPSADLGMCSPGYSGWPCLIVTLNSKSGHLTGVQTT